MGNLTWGGFDLRTTEKVAVRHINGSDLTLRPGDLLFNTRNSADLVGKSAVWRGQIAAAAFDNNINRIRLKPKADPAFYGVYLNTGLGKRRVQSLAVGSTSVAAIYWKDLKNLRVPLPPLPEQRKIAEILRAWDEALEKLSELRAAKEHQYRAFAREFFDPCHPSFHGRPNSWQEFELGDVFTERSQPGEDGERLLSVTMNGGVIDRDDVGRKCGCGRVCRAFLRCEASSARPTRSSRHDSVTSLVGTQRISSNRAGWCSTSSATPKA
jgi:hypothetical protein